MTKKFKELDNVLADISIELHHSHSQIGDSQLESFKKRVSTLEKQLIEKKCNYFLLKESNKNFETSDSATSKGHLQPITTNSETEIQKVSDTGIGNEDANKPSKQRNNKKKVVVTSDTMLNGISEKGLSKFHKVAVENLPGGTSNAIAENVDQLLVKNSDDLIMHVGTK